jgi:hypothetical protein
MSSSPSSQSPQSSTDLKKLQEIIQQNPTLLEKLPSVTINKIYTKATKKATNEMKKNDEMSDDDMDDEDYVNDNEDDNEDDTEDSDEERFVSTKEIELQKMDDKIRYLRLDLNNEQLKTAECEEKNKQLAAKLKSYENTILYVKECIQFINADHTFTINVNIGNLSQYNTDIIESARKFFKIERDFKKIQEYPNVEESIKSNYDRLIQRTFDDIKKNYDKVNNTLKQIDKSVSAMKFVFYLLILVNIFVLIYNSSDTLLTRLLKTFYTFGDLKRRFL